MSLDAMTGWAHVCSRRVSLEDSLGRVMGGLAVLDVLDTWLGCSWDGGGGWAEMLTW